MSHDIETGNINEITTQKCFTFLKYEWNNSKKNILKFLVIFSIYFIIQYSCLYIFEFCFVEDSISNCKNDKESKGNIILTQIATIVFMSCISMSVTLLFIILYSIWMILFNDEWNNYQQIRINKTSLSIYECILFIKFYLLKLNHLNLIKNLCIILFVIYIDYYIIITFKICTIKNTTKNTTCSDIEIKSFKNICGSNVIFLLFPMLIVMMLSLIFHGIYTYLKKSWNDSQSKN